MRRYLRILLFFAKTSLIRETMFRGNFFAELFVHLAWLGFYFGLIEIFFLHTESIAGWSKGEMIVLLGVWSAIDDVLEFFTARNVRTLPAEIEFGKFDRRLVTPADSQFLLTFSRLDFTRIFALLAAIGVIIYGFSLQPVVFTFTSIFAPFLIISGAAISYSILLFIESLAFWFVRMDNLWALFVGLWDIAKYPSDIFGRLGKIIAFTIIPFGVIVMVPAQALLGKASWMIIVYAFIVAVVFLWISRKFYQYSVRRYSSVA